MKKLTLNSTSAYAQHAERTRVMDDYLASIKEYKVPSAEEENELIKKYKETGDIEIRNQIVCSHQRFIYSAAKRFTVDSELVMELVSEGSFGLMEAIEKYDPYKFGNRLMTYAQAYIRRNMNYYLSKIKLVRRDSDSKVGIIIANERNLFFNLNCRYPSNDEIRDIMFEKHGVEYISDFDLEEPLFVSLSSPVRDTEHAQEFETTDEYVSHASSINEYEKEIDDEHIKYVLSEALEKLSDRERGIITMLFGIGYEFPIDPDDVAYHFNMTRTRILQIKNEVLSKMRYSLTA